MRDPLADFPWTRLYDLYDAKCLRFDGRSDYLRAVRPGVRTDRALYYWLFREIQLGRLPSWQLEPAAFEALLYWKHYSGRYGLAPFKDSLAGRDFPASLVELLTVLPPRIGRDVKEIERTIELVGRFRLPGMKDAAALPTRTTFLHFLYPAVVPIFDQMVLRAVGAWREGANGDMAVLTEYVPFAWELAARYGPMLTGYAETPTRLIDMALWVTRVPKS